MLSQKKSKSFHALGGQVQPNPLKGFVASLALATSTILFAIPSFAQAENQLSFYSAYQLSADDKFDEFVIGQDVQSSSPPASELQFGARATRWIGDNWGIGVDYNRYNYELTAQPADVSLRQDRLSLIGAHRFNEVVGVSPYIGAGIGVNFVTNQNNTQGSDYTESVFNSSGLAGASYDINDDLAIFTEFKLDYSFPGGQSDSGDKFDFESLGTQQSFNFGIMLSF